MAGPSAEGYTPLPVEERIDDDVDARPSVDQASDDEDDRYTSNDPLLSRSQREPVPLRRNWFAWCGKVKKWRIWQAKMFHPSRWETTPIKASKQNKILKWVVAFLSVTTLALIIAVSVLGVEKANNSHRYCPGISYGPNSHIPKFNYSDYSYNNYLGLPGYYPPLHPSVDPECKEAWNKMRRLNCHEKILNRAWDDGKHNLFDPEIKHYAEPMCRSNCQESIQRTCQMVFSKCTLEDKFDTTNWVGPLSADPGLEEGPVAVMETISRRLDHTCRLSPNERNSYYYRKSYCVNEIYQDWFIVDGMNAGNLEGLDTFESLTNRSVTRWTPARTWNDYDRTDRYDDGYVGYYPRSNRRLGPRKGETECGFCLLNWFERKLMSWKKDGVLDPKNGTMVDLPTYIHRISRVGSRCEVNDWNRIYRKAIKQYKDYGLLPSDWDGKKDGIAFNSDDAFERPEWAT